MKWVFPEGATPIDDSSHLLISWIQNMSDLNRVEAENIFHAQKRYLKKSSVKVSEWFHFNEFKKIHIAMFGTIWGWAGKQRKSITSIGVSPGLIATRIAELSEEVLAWERESVELTFLEKSARIHHRLVQIHPFENGNGRFSRLVADRYLLRWKCSYPIWPESLQKEGMARKSYIQALKEADRGDYESLIAFMKSCGAANPNIASLFQDPLYLPLMENSTGPAKIRALLRDQKDPNLLVNGRHPLQLLIKTKLNVLKKLEYLKVLIKSGAEIQQADRSGMTALETAKRYGEKELISYLEGFLHQKPNQVTVKALKQSQAGKNIKKFATPDELFKDLGI